MSIEIDGEYTTAEFMVTDESLIEDSCIKQVQSLVDHPAFTEPIRMMPDAHYGAGAPVGFSMPLTKSIVPNIVGVDVGCGMAAAKIGDELPLSDETREQRVRDVVPMGRQTHDYDAAPHLINEFPFKRANTVFEKFNAAYEDQFGVEIDPIEFDFDQYDEAYFKSLSQRVLHGKRNDMGYVIGGTGAIPRRLRRGYAPSLRETLHRLHHHWIFHNT